MNPIFNFTMALLFVLTWVRDGAAVRKSPVATRCIYIALNAVSVFLFTALFFGLRIPMPTEWFIHHVSPWVRAIVETKPGY